MHTWMRPSSSFWGSQTLRQKRELKKPFAWEENICKDNKTSRQPNPTAIKRFCWDEQPASKPDPHWSIIYKYLSETDLVCQFPSGPGSGIPPRTQSVTVILKGLRGAYLVCHGSNQLAPIDLIVNLSYFTTAPEMSNTKIPPKAQTYIS